MNGVLEGKCNMAVFTDRFFVCGSLGGFVWLSLMRLNGGRQMGCKPFVGLF